MLEGAIVGAALGMLGGFLGFLAAKLLATDGDAPKWPIAVGVALAVTLTRPILHYWNSPTTEAQLTELERTEPVYAAIRENDTPLYSQIRSVIGAEAPAENKRTQLRALIIPAALRRLPDTSDDTLLNFARLSSREGHFLAQAAPQDCPLFLSGQEFGAGKVFSADLIQAENAMYNEIFKSPVSPTSVASKSEVDQAMATAIPHLLSDLRVSANELSAALQQKGPLAYSARPLRVFLISF
jgi:hypothetical protein